MPKLRSDETPTRAGSRSIEATLGTVYGLTSCSRSTLNSKFCLAIWNYVRELFVGVSIGMCRSG